MRWFATRRGIAKWDQKIKEAKLGSLIIALSALWWIAQSHCCGCWRQSASMPVKANDWCRETQSRQGTTKVKVSRVIPSDPNHLTCTNPVKFLTILVVYSVVCKTSARLKKQPSNCSWPNKRLPSKHRKVKLLPPIIVDSIARIRPSTCRIIRRVSIVAQIGRLNSLVSYQWFVVYVQPPIVLSASNPRKKCSNNKYSKVLLLLSPQISSKLRFRQQSNLS